MFNNSATRLVRVRDVSHIANRAVARTNTRKTAVKATMKKESK